MPFLNIFFGADFVQIPLIFDKDFGSYLNLVPKKSIWYTASFLVKAEQCQHEWLLWRHDHHTKHIKIFVVFNRFSR